MSTDAAANDRMQKQKEFMQLLPLTIELAGLAHAETGRYFNDGQLEVRANALRAAFKVARQLVIEVGK